MDLEQSPHPPGPNTGPNVILWSQKFDISLDIIELITYVADIFLLEPKGNNNAVCRVSGR